MVDAGGAQVVVGRFADQPALARDESGSDRPALPASGLGDAPGQGVAGLVDDHVEGKARRQRMRRWRQRDLAGDAADGTDAAEEGVAAEIIAASPRRPRRRQQPRRRDDMVPGGDGAGADVDAHPLRPRLGRDTGDVGDQHDQAGADIARLDCFDEARQLADARPVQHRRGDVSGPPDAGGETGKGGGCGETGHGSDAACAEEEGAGCAQHEAQHRRPQRRLTIRGEVEQDAGPHRHRQPEEGPAALGLQRQRPAEAGLPFGLPRLEARGHRRERAQTQGQRAGARATPPSPPWRRRLHRPPPPRRRCD